MDEEIEETGINPAALTDDVLTLKDVDRIHAADITRLDRAETALKDAQKQYAYKTGRQHYQTDAAHDASFGEYLPPLAEAERAAAGAAHIAEHNARQALAQLRTAAAQPALSAAEMAAAAGRESLVAGHVERLPWPALRDRVRHAALSDDKAAQYLYLEHLPTRLAKGDDNHGLPGEQQAREEVRQLLLSLRERLRDTSFDRQIAHLEKTLGAAVSLRLAAEKRAREQETHSFVPAGAVTIPSDL